MADEQEVKGLDADLPDEDSLTNPLFKRMLMNIFEDIQVDISKHVILIICTYCQPGRVYIHTSDGAEITVSRKALALSSLLSIQSESKPLKPIQLMKGTGNALAHVVKFLEYHGGVEPAEIHQPIKSSNIFKIVEDPEDAKFISSLSKRDTFQVILLANYIDCRSLLHLGCTRIAAMIRGKSQEEIRNILHSGEANGDDEKIMDDTKTQEAELKQEASPTPLEGNHVNELGDELNQDNVAEEKFPNEAEDEGHTEARNMLTVERVMQRAEKKRKLSVNILKTPSKRKKLN